mmetsp:Transcript_6427/g.19288  ORF Transcript_6427/g.19288 Transcript_6427/m.19288 type:complete len:304 (-) Transcript_6427:319-1230(-)
MAHRMRCVGCWRASPTATAYLRRPRRRLPRMLDPTQCLDAAARSVAVRMRHILAQHCTKGILLLLTYTGGGYSSIPHLRTGGGGGGGFFGSCTARRPCCGAICCDVAGGGAEDLGDVQDPLSSAEAAPNASRRGLSSNTTLSFLRSLGRLTSSMAIDEGERDSRLAAKPASPARAAGSPCGKIVGAPVVSPWWRAPTAGGVYACETVTPTVQSSLVSRLTGRSGGSAPGPWKIVPRRVRVASLGSAGSATACCQCPRRAGLRACLSAPRRVYSAMCLARTARASASTAARAHCCSAPSSASST